MKYWVFINNSVQGPFTIKEIVEKRYISPDLLVCPTDMLASKPSSWYFARELSEFDPYIDERSVAVADEDFDLSYVVDLPSFQSEFVDDINNYFEKIVKEEKQKIEKHETFSYFRKISDLEENIKDLNEKLSKAFEVIKEYEKGLKEKDSIIERLEREIENIKKLREEDNKTSFEKIKDYEDTLKAKEGEIENLKKELREVNQKINMLKGLSQDTEVKDDSLALSSGNKIPDNLEKLEISSNIDDGRTNILNFNIEQEFGDKVREETVLSGSLSLEDANSSAKKVDEVVSKVEITPTVDTIIKREGGDNKIIFADDKQSLDSLYDKDSLNISNKSNEKLVLLKPIEEIQNISVIDDNKSNILDSIDIPAGKFQSEQAIEKEIPFQVADVSFEFVETKLDKVETSRIEPVLSQADVFSTPQPQITVNEQKHSEIEPRKNIFDNNALSSKPLEEEKKSIDLNQLINKNKEPEKNFEKSKEINHLQQLTSTQNIFSETKASLEKEEVKTDKYFANEKLDKPKEERLTIREKKISKFLLIGGVGVIIFFFALVYILRNGENVTKSKTQPIVKNVYQEEVSSETLLSDNSKTPQQSNSIEREKDDEVKISKINENVKNAIDIVKNYNLGDGKGSIEKWLSNTVASAVKGKEEWNATYLSGSIFVVQYRFLRYRAEPVVYLFEVDVDKREIVRGINNNAINLLSGKKSQLKSATAKKVNLDNHIEKDDEMF